MAISGRHVSERRTAPCQRISTPATDQHRPLPPAGRSLHRSARTLQSRSRLERPVPPAPPPFAKRPKQTDPEIGSRASTSAQTAIAIPRPSAFAAPPTAAKAASRWKGMRRLHLVSEHQLAGAIRELHESLEAHRAILRPRFSRDMQEVLRGVQIQKDRDTQGRHQQQSNPACTKGGQELHCGNLDSGFRVRTLPKEHAISLRGGWSLSFARVFPDRGDRAAWARCRQGCRHGPCIGRRRRRRRCNGQGSSYARYSASRRGCA